MPACAPWRTAPAARCPPAWAGRERIRTPRCRRGGPRRPGCSRSPTRSCPRRPIPPRQRAVLILRDVLEWRAAEVADLLGTSTTAVNSMLQRARAQLRLAAPDEGSLREPADPRRRELLARYATAFENADVAALTGLLREDAVLQMPPQPTWFAGRDRIGRFLQARVLLRPGDFRLVPTAANGQPALAAYLRDDDGVHRAHGIQVLSVAGPVIAQIVSF